MVVAAGRTLTADYPLRDSGVRARGELEVPLKHALQRLDLVESLAKLLLQTVVGLLQIEGVALQQRDALGQFALPLGRCGAEDPGYDRVDNAVVCHRSISWKPSCWPQLGGDFSISRRWAFP